MCSMSWWHNQPTGLSPAFSCICVTHSQEIRRNETHLNLGSGLGQGTIKNFRGSQFQDFLNTRGVRADKELACQLLSPFKKRWHQSYRLRRFKDLQCKVICRWAGALNKWGGRRVLWVCSMSWWHNQPTRLSPAFSCICVYLGAFSCIYVFGGTLLYFTVVFHFLLMCFTIFHHIS